MPNGWIKLHRHLQDDPLWLSEPFTRGQAWVDLLGLANHADGYIRVNGERIDIKRGQLGYSILSLSKRWKWSRGKITRFLKEIEEQFKITLKTNTRNSIITICNYDVFQGGVLPNEHQTNTKRTPNEHQTNTNKKKEVSKKEVSKKEVSKKEEEKKHTKKNLSEFEEFFEFYQKHGTEQKALKSYTTAIKEGATYEAIIKGLKKYQAQCRANNIEQRFIKHASTWLNDKGWKQEYPIYRTQSKSTTLKEAIRATLQPQESFDPWKMPED